MRWSNVWVIFLREVRDQLRDKRTLFMVFVLPILLYPLLGFGILKLGAEIRDRDKTVIVVGAAYLPDSPPLLNEQRDRFVPKLFNIPSDADKLIVKLEPPDSPWTNPESRRLGLRS